MAQPSNTTQSVQRALMILNTFSDDTPLQRVSDIARRVQLTPSTVSRLLGTMLDMGFVERDEVSGFYRLGYQILTLSGVVLHSHEIYRHAYPELYKLSAETDLHIFLGIQDHDELVHVASVGAEDTNDLFTPVGYRHPMFCCAMGKAILAYLDDSEVNLILKNSELIPYTPYTVVNPGQIKKDLKKIRMLGYAVIREELTIGKASIAAPIFNRKRVPVGAISISGDLEKMNLPQNEKELSRKVLLTAAKVSGKLGYFPK